MGSLWSFASTDGKVTKSYTNLTVKLARKSVLMVIFPPYIVKSYNQVVIKSGYGFIFNLPPFISGRTVIPSTINVSSLFIQMLAALIVGGLIFIVFKKRQME
jgi:hypothetical protein